MQQQQLRRVAAPAADAGSCTRSCRQRGRPSWSQQSGRQPDRAQRQRQRLRLHAQQQQQGGLGDTLRRAAKQMQASLPVIGLLSRLAAPSGGVGNDMTAYPEYCRAIFEAAPEDFQLAVAALQDRHGRPCQRRYVLCALWMVRLGTGLLPAKDIANAARRVGVSYDLEYEISRFTESYQEARAKYTYMAPPQPPPQALAELAVDCLARLCCGLADGEAFDPDDAPLIAAAAASGLWFDDPGAPSTELAAAAVASRDQRAAAYA